MASENRKFNRSKNVQKGWNVKERRALIVFGALVITIGVFTSRFVFQNFDGEEAFNEVYIEGIVPDSIVCMLDNRTKQKPTISLIIEGKEYRGCCTKCIDKLLINDNNIRIAEDPYSGAKLDKADAIIYSDRFNRGKVLYFESEENYINYTGINSKK